MSGEQLSAKITIMEQLMDIISKLLGEKLKICSSEDDLKAVKMKMETRLDKFTTLICDILKENQLLKQKVRVLEENNIMAKETCLRLEKRMKEKNIIIRGVKKNKNIKKAIDDVIREKLKIAEPIEYQTLGKLSEKNDKMDVLVELKSKKMVQKVLRHGSNLKRSAIIMELDLIPEQLQDKKVLLQLRKDILFLNKSHNIIVRSDRIKIAGNWLKWNSNRELMCGTQKAEDVLFALYGSDMPPIDLNYNNILAKLNS